jgi:hypothetical protein
MPTKPFSKETQQLVDEALDAVIAEAYIRVQKESAPNKPTPANLAANMHYVFIQYLMQLGEQYQLRHLAWVAAGAKGQP